MKSKITWLILTCSVVLSLALASCAPAPSPEVKPTPKPSIAEKPAPTPVEEKPALIPGMEVVKDSLGRLVEKPQYGGVFNYPSSEPVHDFDTAYTVIWRCFSINWTNDKLRVGDWSKGPTGSGEAGFLVTAWTDENIVAPALAVSWELPDDQTLIWHIRKGVRFHDKPPVNGREMTAEDVAFSIKRYFGPPTGPPSAYGYVAVKPEDRPTSVTATDKWTVVVKCQPGKSASMRGGTCNLVPIYPPEMVAKWGNMRDWKTSCGTGPFILVDYVPGSSMKLVRNPNYWMKDPLHPKNQLPYLDGIKFLIIPDASTRLAAFRTAKTDWASASWEEKRDLLRTNPELKYAKRMSTSPAFLGMRIDKPELPFKDVRVRRALNMAIDRQTIIKDYYGGEAEMLIFPILSPSVFPEYKDMYVPLEQLPKSVQEYFQYNPAKAKQLLAEAGYPKGFKTTVVTYGPYVDMCQLLKAYFADIGVDMELKVYEPTVWQSIASARTHKEMIYRYSALTTASFYECNPRAEHNASMVDDPRINEFQDAIGKQELMLDRAKRYKLTKELVPYVLEQAWYVFPPDPYSYTMWQPWVKSYNGEWCVGTNWYYNFPNFIWLDQDLKEKMTGRR